MKSNLAIEKACEKGKRIINSLYSVGLNACGINLIATSNIWKRAILPAVLYGGEIWNNPVTQSLEALEQLQRYFARRTQGFPRRSPKITTTGCLDLWTMQG